MTVAAALQGVGSFAALLSEPFDEAMTYAVLRKAESLGRLVGSKAWIAEMETRTGRTLAPQKHGPAPRAKVN